MISDGTIAAMEAFRGRLGLELPFATTEAQWDRFGVTGVPTLLLADPRGRVERIWRGGETLERAVAFLAGLPWKSAASAVEPLGRSDSDCSSCER